MRHEINAALKQHLSEKFGVVDQWRTVTWVEDTDEFMYRLIFEFNDSRLEGRAKIALRYVDIVMTGDCILAFAQNRKSTRVEYAAPGSIEILERFIDVNCAKRRRL